MCSQSGPSSTVQRCWREEQPRARKIQHITSLAEGCSEGRKLCPVNSLMGWVSLGGDAAGRQSNFASCVCAAPGRAVSERGRAGAGSGRGGSGCCIGCGKGTPAVGGCCRAQGALPMELPPLDLAQHQRSDVFPIYNEISLCRFVFLVDEKGWFDFRKEFPLSSGATPIPIFPCQFLWLYNLFPLFYQ